MLSKEEFLKLKPKELSSLEKESFEEAYPRLKEFLPNFPECVLEQWTYRHFDQFDHDYWWLGLDGLTFRLETWTNDEILHNIGSKIIETQDYWGDELVIRRNKIRLTTWLAQYFVENKTWPKPVIVLKNNLSLKRPNGLPLAEPFHLLEGHMRLAYMRGHIRHEVEGTPEKHDVWIAECDPEKVSDKW